MNTPNIFEIHEKLIRIRDYLEKNGYGALIIGRQDNFSWLTGGGDHKVIVLSETGSSLLIITPDKKYLIAYVMDGRRIIEEELAGTDFEYVPVRWYEGSLAEKALELIRGKKAASDMYIPGTDFIPDQVCQLHYPLLEHEIKRLRWLGDKAEEIVTRVAFEAKPGMSEYEVQAMLLSEFGKEDIACSVLLIGSDERVGKYRHPLPSNKKIGNYLFMAPVPRKWGLNAPLTRLVYFGDSIPKEMEKKYDAVRTIAAASISMCQTGTRFAEILHEQKRLYKELGYEEEWRNHFQGGITGYQIVNATLCKHPDAVVQENEAYAWFITITGVKSEELSLNQNGIQEILTVNGKWPTKEYCYNRKRFCLADIMKK